MKKYLFDNKIYADKQSLDEAVYIYAFQHFDEHLDGIYEPVNVMCELTYPTSRVLKDTDPIVYRCYLSNYESSLYDDVEEVDVNE